MASSAAPSLPCASAECRRKSKPAGGLKSRRRQKLGFPSHHTVEIPTLLFLTPNPSPLTPNPYYLYTLNPKP